MDFFNMEKKYPLHQKILSEPIRLLLPPLKKEYFNFQNIFNQKKIAHLLKNRGVKMS